MTGRWEMQWITGEIRRKRRQTHPRELLLTHIKRRPAALCRRFHFEIIFRPDPLAILEIPLVDEVAGQLPLSIAVRDVRRLGAFPRRHVSVLLVHADLLPDRALPVVTVEAGKVKALKNFEGL
jgi:hypothetical protein